MARTGVWQNAAFLQLWAAQSISALGSQVTLLALSLTAVLFLHAGPVQMGLLGAVQLLPDLLLGLVAGVWVDRLRRRPLLIGTDVGRALLLASIPLAAAFGRLHLAQLYVVGFLGGGCTVVFSAAYQAFLPAIVGRAALVDANSKLQASYYVASTAGPGLAGVLVQVLTAPLAIAADALSFLVSVLALVVVPVVEPPPRPRAERQHLWQEIAEGLRAILHQPLLRASIGSAALLNFFARIMSPLYVLYMTRQLGLGPSALGSIFASAGVGGMLGALLAGTAIRHVGLGRGMIGALLLVTVGTLLIPLAGSLPHAAVLPLLLCGLFLVGLANPLFGVGVVSLVQSVTADHLQGRVAATTRFSLVGSGPVSLLLGGFGGALLGLQPTLLLGACGMLSGVVWLLVSPVRHLIAVPALLGDAESIAPSPVAKQPADTVEG